MCATKKDCAPIPVILSFFVSVKFSHGMFHLLGLFFQKIEYEWGRMINGREALLSFHLLVV